MSLTLIFVFLVGFLEVIGQSCDFNETQLTVLDESFVISNVNKSDGLIPGSPYAYEAWTDASPPDNVEAGKKAANFNLTIYVNDSNGYPTAAFKASWNDSSDFLARTGLQMDEGRIYTYYKNIKADYAYKRSPWRNCTKVDSDCTSNCDCADGGVAGDYSYIGVYGWTRDPLVEYYIVDDWMGNRWQDDTTPVGAGTICYDVPNNDCLLGQYTVDGSVYRVYTHHRVAWNIIDYGPFEQYYSVRVNQRKCGTISITEHFKQWESFGLTMQGTLYEAKLLAEAGGGEGFIDYTYADVSANNQDKCGTYSDDHYEFPGCGLRACVDRRKNSLNPNEPCGPDDCFWDRGAANRTSCIDEDTNCTNSDHYDGKDSVKHACIPKACTSRTKNSIVRLEPCGPDDCYWDTQSTDPTKCIESSTPCTNSEHYEQKESSHSCELKDCADRTKNGLNPNEPCGPGDCYWDTQATDKCIAKGTPCTNSDLYEQKDDIHACGLKPQDPEPAGSSIATVNVALLLLAVFWLTFG